MLIWAISGKYTYPLSVPLEDIREPMVFFRKGQIANFGKKTPQVQRKTPQEILIIPPPGAFYSNHRPITSQQVGTKE